MSKHVKLIVLLILVFIIIIPNYFNSVTYLKLFLADLTMQEEVRKYE